MGEYRARMVFDGIETDEYGNEMSRFHNISDTPATPAQIMIPRQEHVEDFGDAKWLIVEVRPASQYEIDAIYVFLEDN